VAGATGAELGQVWAHGNRTYCLPGTAQARVSAMRRAAARVCLPFWGGRSSFLVPVGDLESFTSRWAVGVAQVPTCGASAWQRHTSAALGRGEVHAGVNPTDTSRAAALLMLHLMLPASCFFHSSWQSSLTRVCAYVSPSARPLTALLNRTFHSSASARSSQAPAAMVEKVRTTERLAGLRQLMREHHVDAYSTQHPGRSPSARAYS
jgi:hypothetical protein